MLRKWSWIILLGTVILSAALYVSKAKATPASVGFAGTTLAMGRMGDIPLSFVQLIQKDAPPWVSMQFAKGSSDLYVQNNVWQPKAHTGWHSHPGHSLIIVTAGTLTNYEASDPDCKPVVYTQGQAFVDHGGNDVHNIRNDTTGISTSIAIQLIPAGAQRRVDVPQPTNCPSFPPF